MSRADDWGKCGCGGAKASGQLVQGNTTNLPRASRVKLDASNYLQDALEISCGEAHSVVVRWKTGDPCFKGGLFVSGSAKNGRLGNLPLGTSQATLDGALAVSYPVQVMKSDGSPLDQISSVAAGSSHTLALDLSGNAWAWVENGFGALGDNLTADRGYAMKVKNPAGTGDLQNIVRIAVGGTGLNNYSMAVAADGTVYTWGYNGTSQLGNATFSTTAVNKLPVAVTGGLDLLPNPPAVTLAVIVTAGSFPEPSLWPRLPRTRTMTSARLISKAKAGLSGN